METWAPSVISGLFSIVVVIIGAVLISQRERNHREEDQERDDKNSQRTAVANFIRAIEELNGRSTENWAEWLSLSPEEKQTGKTLWFFYYGVVPRAYFPGTPNISVLQAGEMFYRECSCKKRQRLKPVVPAGILPSLESVEL